MAIPNLTCTRYAATFPLLDVAVWYPTQCSDCATKLADKSAAVLQRTEQHTTLPQASYALWWQFGKRSGTKLGQALLLYWVLNLTRISSYLSHV